MELPGHFPTGFKGNVMELFDDDSEISNKKKYIYIRYNCTEDALNIQKNALNVHTFHKKQ